MGKFEPRNLDILTSHKAVWVGLTKIKSCITLTLTITSFRDFSEFCCRSRSYDDEGELPEWSMADTDDMEGLGTFDSSGAFMSMKVNLQHFSFPNYQGA